MEDVDWDGGGGLLLTDADAYGYGLTSGTRTRSPSAHEIQYLINYSPFKDEKKADEVS
jgi:hypothetical protein